MVMSLDEAVQAVEASLAATLADFPDVDVDDIAADVVESIAVQCESATADELRRVML